MPIYWVTTYFTRADKGPAYQKWLKSPGAKRLFKQFEKETGFRYLNTYFPILGVGDYDAEDWMVAPNWAAADKFRSSKAWEEWIKKTWNLLDQTKPLKTRVMRTAQDVMIPTPPSG